MKFPLQITFCNMDHSGELRDAVIQNAEKLDPFADSIKGCCVVIERDPRRQKQGNLYHVRVVLTLPDREIFIDRNPGRHVEDRDLAIAIRDTFDAAYRQLEEVMRRRRGAVKPNEACELLLSR